MIITDIMRDYNKYERKSVSTLNGVMESNDELTKFISEDYYGSYISYFNFDESRTDAIIKEQIAYFQARNLCFEWKTYSTDTPNNLSDKLLCNGFKQAETESFMALALEGDENQPFEDSIITEVSDSKGIRDAIIVQERVWGEDFEWQYHYLLQLKQRSPDLLNIYVIYVDNQPIASAWLTFKTGSPFAGIWGGSTIKAFRGNGYYSALLNKRIAVAKSRGLKYLIIDASDMSKPIVTKRGFKVVATTTGYISPSY